MNIGFNNAKRVWLNNTISHFELTGTLKFEMVPGLLKNKGSSGLWSASKIIFILLANISAKKYVTKFRNKKFRKDERYFRLNTLHF